MSKFGLLESDADPTADPLQPSISERIASFTTVRERHIIDLAQVDAAAAPHGFVSREAIKNEVETSPRVRRRRAVPPEPTRHLAVRLTSSQYNRFVAFADRYQLTYHEALIQLMDRASE